MQEEYAFTTPADIRFGAGGFRTTLQLGDAGYNLPIRMGTAAKFDASQGAKFSWVTFALSTAQSFFSNAIFSYDWANVISSVEQSLGSILLPNHSAALRANYGTANETYAFHVLGPANDHMHTQDDGGFSLWALNAPVSLQPNNLYNPLIYDAGLSGGITMATDRPWLSPVDQALCSNGLGWCIGSVTDRFSGLTAPTTVNYFAGSKVQWSEGQQIRTGGPTWNRRIRVFNFDPNHPIIDIGDSFTGTGSTLNKIFHYPQYSTSAVTNAPGGTYTPTINDWTVNASAPTCTTFALWEAAVGSGGCAGSAITWGQVSPAPPAPAMGSAVNLTTSALNRFSFVGDGGHQYNTSGTINWDFYVLPSGASPQFAIGSSCLPIQGDGYFGPLESATNPKECQEMLKVNSAGTTQEAFWLPYLRSGTANGVPTPQSCGTQVVLPNGQTACWDPHHSQSTDGTTSYLATEDSTSETFGGLTISGGPGECDWNATTGTIYVSGLVAGVRTITLPAGFTITTRTVIKSGSNYLIYHPGDGITYSFTISTTPVSRRVAILNFAPPNGVSTVRIKVGSNYVGVVTVTSNKASITLDLPSAGQTTQHEFLDGSGNIIFVSPQTIL